MCMEKRRIAVATMYDLYVCQLLPLAVLGRGVYQIGHICYAIKSFACIKMRYDGCPEETLNTLVSRRSLGGL